MITALIIYAFWYVVSFLKLYKLVQSAYTDVEDLIVSTLTKTLKALASNPTPILGLPKVDSEIESRVVRHVKKARPRMTQSLFLKNALICPIVFFAILFNEEDFDRTFDIEFKKALIKDLNSILQHYEEALSISKVLEAATEIITANGDSEKEDTTL